MDPHAPFTGVLLLPGRALFDTSSEVTLEDGRPVAAIRWYRFSGGSRFDVLDPSGGTVLASGSRKGFWGKQYQLLSPREEMLLEFKVSGWGLNGRNTVTLPGGRQLTAKGNWTARQFAVRDEHDRPVAGLVNTSRFYALRQDSLAFELTRPELSAVQAIGLAQCVRAAAEAAQSAANSSATFG
jgi:hypothetical protein